MLNKNSSKLTVFALQYDVAWEDPSANYQKIVSLIENKRPTPNSLILLPEMAFTGFSMNSTKVLKLLIEFDILQKISDLSKSTKSYIGFGNVQGSSQGKISNLFQIIDPSGDLVYTSGKSYPFTIMGEEKTYYPFTHSGVFPLGDFNLFPTICYDLRFPELYRHGLDLGADVFINIANFPQSRHAHWTTLCCARAIENQAYMIGVNRIGKDQTVVYGGSSLVIDPNGDLIKTIGNEEGVLISELDSHLIKAHREKWPFIRNRKLKK